MMKLEFYRMGILILNPNFKDSFILRSLYTFPSDFYLRVHAVNHVSALCRRRCIMLTDE